MTLLKRLLIQVIAAIAAHSAPRKAGIGAFIPAMLILGPVLGMPVFAVLLAVVRLITRMHPPLHESVLPLGLDSICAGFVIAAELVRIWRLPIETQLAIYDTLEPEARLRLRARYLTAALASCVLALDLLLLMVRNP
jgi:hypothetical protein